MSKFTEQDKELRSDVEQIGRLLKKTTRIADRLLACECVRNLQRKIGHPPYTGRLINSLADLLVKWEIAAGGIRCSKFRPAALKFAEKFENFARVNFVSE